MILQNLILRTWLAILLTLTPISNLANSASTPGQLNCTPQFSCPEKASMPASERFKLLYEGLQENFRVYTGNVIQTAGFILLALGWIPTSDKARSYLRANRLPRVLSQASVVAIGLIHYAVCWALFSASRRRSEQLSSLSYLEPSYYADYILSKSLLTINAALILLFLVILGLSIWNLREEATSNANTTAASYLPDAGSTKSKNASVDQAGRDDTGEA